MEWQTIIWIIVVLILIYVAYSYMFREANMLNKNMVAGNNMLTITPSTISTDMDSANFTYSMWFYINNWNTATEKSKN